MSAHITLLNNNREVDRQLAKFLTDHFLPTFKQSHEFGTMSTDLIGNSGAEVTDKSASLSPSKQ